MLFKWNKFQVEIKLETIMMILNVVDYEKILPPAENRLRKVINEIDDNIMSY